MSLITNLHVFSALFATIVGAVVLMQTKGTKQHKMLGRSFAIAMLIVNVTAFAMYPKHGFSIFQPLALWSTINVLAAVYYAVKKTKENWLVYHYYFICYAYLGVLAAALARVPQALGINATSSAFIAIGIVFLIGMMVLEKNAKSATQA
jgi:uncharacterized membrane protein